MGRGAWGQWRHLTAPVDTKSDGETPDAPPRHNYMEPVVATVGVESLAWVAQRRTVQYVYTFDGLDVGECQLQRHGTDPEAEVWAFEVYKPYRRQGAGKRMYAALEMVARESGVKHLGLWTQDGNEVGQLFWLAQGFKHIKHTPRGWWMEKRL